MAIAPPETAGSQPIHHIKTDSRLPFPRNSLFIALSGIHHDGHLFLKQAVAGGASAAIILKTANVDRDIGIPLLRVKNTLAALQKIAKEHHCKYGPPTLAVTGSNGKTIFKDLLVSILNNTMQITASPGSYNSQVGVALSLLQLSSKADLAIVEAGISEPGEMARLQAMIQPQYGVLTNIGFAHLEGLATRQNIAKEKCILFKNLPSKGWLLTPIEPLLPRITLEKLACRRLSFGAPNHKQLPQISAIHRLGTNQTLTEWVFPGNTNHQAIIAIDAAWSEMFETILAAVAAAYLLGTDPDQIIESLNYFEPPQNRLELWQSPQGFTLINDSYSSDPVSVHAGLNVLGHFTNKRRIFLFGGMQGLGAASHYQHQLIGEAAARQKVDWLITLGATAEPTLDSFKQFRPGADTQTFPNLDQALSHLETTLGAKDSLLIKGPRQANFPIASQRLKGHLSPTSFTVNLSKISHNLLVFRALFESQPKIMVMVKAFAYGMDAVIVARYLQNMGISHLGVAYLREAQSLRRNGIHQQIVVQLVLAEEAETVVQLGLQPVVFNLSVAQALATAAQKANKQVRIHLKIDTGMGRFGLFPNELPTFLTQLKAFPQLLLEGVMTHFSAADDPTADDFTRQQLACFNACLAIIETSGYQPTYIHAAATAAAVRFPQARFNMVRLGLGLYGIAPSKAVAESLPEPLECPFALMSQLSFIKAYPEGYPISYNRRYQTARPSRIGFIPMGYHDGLGYGLTNRGHVKIGQFDAPMVGSICMDFTAVDVTDIPDAVPGSPVLILGSHQGQHLPVESMAQQLGTIPYEVLCQLSRRIQRIYIIEEQ